MKMTSRLVVIAWAFLAACALSCGSLLRAGEPAKDAKPAAKPAAKEKAAAPAATPVAAKPEAPAAKPDAAGQVYVSEFSVTIADTAGSPAIKTSGKGEFALNATAGSVEVKAGKSAAALSVGDASSKAAIPDVAVKVALAGAGKAASVTGLDKDAAALVSAMVDPGMAGAAPGAIVNRETALPLGDLGMVPLKLSSCVVDKPVVNKQPCVVVETVGFGQAETSKHGVKLAEVHFRVVSLVATSGALMRASGRSRCALTGADGQMQVVWAKVETSLKDKAIQTLAGWPVVASLSSEEKLATRYGAAGVAGMAAMAPLGMAGYVFGHRRGRARRAKSLLALFLSLGMILWGGPGGLGALMAAMPDGASGVVVSMTASKAVTPVLAPSALAAAGSGPGGVASMCVGAAWMGAGLSGLSAFVQSPEGVAAWAKAKGGAGLTDSLAVIKEATSGLYAGPAADRHLLMTEKATQAGWASLTEAKKHLADAKKYTAQVDEPKAQASLAKVNDLAFNQAYKAGVLDAQRGVEFAKSCADAAQRLAVRSGMAAETPDQQKTAAETATAARGILTFSVDTQALSDSLLRGVAEVRGDYNALTAGRQPDAPGRIPRPDTKPSHWDEYKWWYIGGAAVLLGGGIAAAAAGGGGGGGDGGTTTDVTVSQRQITLTVW
ncbi:MAG TPA: hypothetical protein P5137_01190, partial [Candidatus Brocadiia bacterium]|nr:hypothetical protein [Candidatus Brocadiia bacterium]